MPCLLSFLFAGFSLMASLCAQDKIWVGLVKAENQQIPLLDPRLERFETGLKRVFGFENYRLVGEAQVPTQDKYAQWVLPRRDFYLKVEPLPSGPGPVVVHRAQIELYREQRLLTQSVFHIDHKTRVFINGPDCPNGRLIFILDPVLPPTPTP
jgi:hypothetical protein